VLLQNRCKQQRRRANSHKARETEAGAMRIAKRIAPTFAILAISAIFTPHPFAQALAADAALIDAAKKEGQVVWYTTLIVNQAVRPLAKAFMEKYPGVEVRYSRADSGPTELKILNEARAGRLQADVFDGNGTVPPLVQAGLVAAYLPPTADRYPDELKDPNRHWISTNLYFLTPGINTFLVSTSEVPRTLADLLAPKWRGRIAWSNNPTAGAGTFIGTVLRRLGEKEGMDYLRALAKQKIVNVDATSRAVLDQVITGEYAMALDIFNHHAVLSAAKGAPVDWLKLEPIAAPIQVASVLKDAPHPSAGRLLLEFLTSEEGQRIFAAVDYIPAMPGIPAKVAALKPDTGGFAADVLPPELLAQNTDRWMTIAQQLFQ
jgi:ABC-type Fe3+ transport system substrate-binding protein